MWVLVGNPYQSHCMFIIRFIRNKRKLIHLMSFLITYKTNFSIDYSVSLMLFLGPLEDFRTLQGKIFMNCKYDDRMNK